LVVAGGVVTSATIVLRGTGYVSGDVLTASIPAGTGFRLVLGNTMSFVSLYQHEIGTDAVTGAQVSAIYSSFETNDLGLVSGGPSQLSLMGDNFWIHLERVEPDFVQSGDMDMYVVGPPFAQGTDKVTGPYTFSPNTGKIDLREQRRELRLRFVSNVAGGNYQLGKLLLNANVGDVRPYGP
jgi:hypothetical protein